MPRYYKQISEENFTLEINKVFSYYEENYVFNPTIEKDLSKVNFDRENMSRIEEIPDFPDEDFADYPMGLKKLDNDLIVYWMIAGGDWEFPICWVFYWDGKSIRAYIPKDGNAYNKEKKSAYGNNEDDIDIESEDGDSEINHNDLIADIKGRLKLKV